MIVHCLTFFYVPEVFARSSLKLGSTSTSPSGKMMVGTLLFPLIKLMTNFVASLLSSSPTRRYLIPLDQRMPSPGGNLNNIQWCRSRSVMVAACIGRSRFYSPLVLPEIAKRIAFGYSFLDTTFFMATLSCKISCLWFLRA